MKKFQRDPSKRTGRKFRRREALAAFGVGATSLVAGCLGTGDDEAEPGDEGDTGSVVTNEFTTTFLGSQEDVQFNPHNLTLGADWELINPLFTRTIIDSRTHREYYPIGLADWSVDGGEVSITVLEGLTWHNGDPVTAEDYVRTLRLQFYQGPTGNARLDLEPYVDDPEDIYAEDEYRLRVELDERYNPELIEKYIVGGSEHGGNFLHHEELYGEYLDRFEDAGSDDEITEIQAELSEETIRDPEPYANGPFQLEEIDTQGIRYSTYDDYPWPAVQENLEENYGLDLSAFPDELNFETLQVNFYSDRQALQQAGITGDIDGGSGFEIDSETDLNQFPEYGDYNPITSGWTDAFVFNVVNGEYADLWRDQRVRKAFAHILDFEGISHQYSGEFGIIDRRDHFSGMSPPMLDIVSDDFLDQLTTYEQDHDLARELLEDAGFTEEGGQWYTPNDELFEVPWAAPSTVQWQIDGMEYAADNLSEFGIESTVEVVEGTTFFGQTIPNLEYELSRGFIGFGIGTEGWENTWIRYDSGDDMEDPFSYYLQEPYGEPGLQVPPIGEPDSDDRVEIDPLELYHELTRTDDEARIEEISQELSWAFNQTVPKLPGSSGVYGWYMTERWDYPDDYGQDPLAGLMPWTYVLPQIGALSAKTEDEYEG